MRDADYDEILPCCNCLKLWCGRQYHHRNSNESADTSADHHLDRKQEDISEQQDR